MCRHLGYVGPERTVASVLTVGGHSLLRQSWAPRDMRGGGTVNADGYGAAWWGDGVLGRHRSAQPIWSDAALGEHGVLGHVRSTAVLAAVRSATVGMPVAESACAPFTDGRWAFSHNGVVRGWPHSMAQLAGELSAVDAITLEAPTDSALLWALLRRRLETEHPALAMHGLLLDVEAVAPGSRLNFLLGDGSALIASAWDHSLWWRRSGEELWVASEPLDAGPTDPGPIDPGPTDGGPMSGGAGWVEVPDRSVLVADLDSVHLEQIGSP